MSEDKDSDLQHFGGERWKQLYRDQLTLDDSTMPIRSSSWEAISSLYKERLKDTFETRYLDKSLILKNRKGSPLFELVFCTGSTRRSAILASHRIAKYIIDYETHSTNTKADVNSG